MPWDNVVGPAVETGASTAVRQIRRPAGHQASVDSCSASGWPQPRTSNAPARQQPESLRKVTATTRPFDPAGPDTVSVTSRT